MLANNNFCVLKGTLIRPKRSLNSPKSHGERRNSARYGCIRTDLICRHHVVVEIRHDPERSAHQKNDDQDAESQRQHVIGVVGGRGDMQKEYQMPPICAIASTTRATGMFGCPTRLVPGTKNEVAVGRLASPNPVRYAAFCALVTRGNGSLYRAAPNGPCESRIFIGGQGFHRRTKQLNRE
jgi:hypothetical protein